MNTRLFLLLERLQKLDARLHFAELRTRPDLVEVARLRARKHTLRERLARLMSQRLPRAF